MQESEQCRSLKEEGQIVGKEEEGAVCCSSKRISIGPKHFKIKNLWVDDEMKRTGFNAHQYCKSELDLVRSEKHKIDAVISSWLSETLPVIMLEWDNLVRGQLSSVDDGFAPRAIMVFTSELGKTK